MAEETALPGIRRTVSEQLADFAIALTLADVPLPVVDKAKLHILDALGIALAASRLKAGRIVAGLVRDWGGAEESSALPYGFKVPAPNAALVVGSLIHGLDYDDTHMGSITHPGAPIVPTALALAEREGLGGRAFLEACIAGFETICRIGRAAPGKLHRRGYHPTSLCGTLASALVAARLLGLDPERAADALGIAGTLTSGSSQVIREGALAKTVNAGRAANSGIIAVLLAQRGMDGIRNVLEGKLGFYESYVGPGEYDLEAVTRDLGILWMIPEIEFKHYPVGFLGNQYMDAAAKLKASHGIRAEEIEEIVYGEWATQVQFASEPAAPKRRPRTGYEAKFSRYYEIAAVFVEEVVTLDTFEDERVTDPRILALAERVRYEIDNEHRWVRVRLKDGRVFQQVQDYVEPLDQAGVLAKFRQNARGVVPPEAAERVIELVDGLDRDCSPQEIIHLCSGVR